MTDRWAKISTAVLWGGCCLFAIYLAFYRPYLLNDVALLGAIVFLQVLLAAIWKFRQIR